MYGSISKQSTHTQYINAIVNVYEDPECSWAVDGKRLELLERTIVVDFPLYDYPPEEDTFDFEYDELDEIDEMEPNEVYAIYMKLEVSAWVDYWGEGDGSHEILEIKHRKLENYFETEKSYQLEQN